MKKLLILAFDFPPYVSVGGLRPYNWFRYLKEFEMEPIVITRQWSNQYGNHLDYIAPGSSDYTIVEKSEFGTVIRTPYHPNLSNRLLLNHGEKKFKLLRKSISGFYEFAQFLYPVGPKSKIYAAARAYLKENKVDAIIASGDPFILFHYASQLSKEFDVPWIADYRDSWVQDKTRSGNPISKYWNKYFEKRSLKNVTLITTVSTFLQKHIQQNIIEKKFEILINGFNPDNIQLANNIDQNSKILTISFAGTIYKWHPIEIFLRSVEHSLKANNLNDVRLNFYGLNDQVGFKELIETKFDNLLEKIHVFQKLENEELIKELAPSNVFLLFNDYSILGTKIFTYLGIRRKMILCYSNDQEAKKLKEKYYRIEEFESESGQLQADLIRETNSGIIVKDSEHLMEVLHDLYEEFQSTGKIACNSVGVENYSRKIQVEKLAELVKNMTACSSS